MVKRNRIGSEHRRFRLGRLLGVVVVLACAIELLYLLVANVVLGRFLTRWLNSSAEDLKVYYGQAWSPWPGRVYLRDFDLIVQDQNTQFELILPRAELDIALGSLLQKTVRLTRLDTQGVRFRFRHKLRELRGNDRHFAALPPISGFTEPPLIHRKPQGPPGAPWTIHITGIDAEVNELWFQEYRYLGRGRTQGGFEFIPERRLGIEPSTVSLEPGSLYVGEKRRVSRDLTADIATSIDDLDVQRKKGRKILEAISARVALRGGLENLAFGRLYFPHDSKLALVHGAGPLDVRVEMIRGHVQPGSRIDYHTQNVELRGPRVRLQGDASVRLEVTRHQRAQLLVRASKLGFGENGSAAAVQARRTELRLDARMPGLHQSWHAPDAFLVLPEIRANDLNALNPLVGPKVALSGGPVQASARADLDASGALSGELGLDFWNALVRFGQSRVSGSGRFQVALRQPNARGGQGWFGTSLAGRGSRAAGDPHRRHRTRLGARVGSLDPVSRLRPRAPRRQSSSRFSGRAAGSVGRRSADRRLARRARQTPELVGPEGPSGPRARWRKHGGRSRARLDTRRARARQVAQQSWQRARRLPARQQIDQDRRRATRRQDARSPVRERILALSDPHRSSLESAAPVDSARRRSRPAARSRTLSTLIFDRKIGCASTAAVQGRRRRTGLARKCCAVRASDRRTRLATVRAGMAGSARRAGRIRRPRAARSSFDVRARCCPRGNPCGSDRGTWGKSCGRSRAAA